MGRKIFFSFFGQKGTLTLKEEVLLSSRYLSVPTGRALFIFYSNLPPRYGYTVDDDDDDDDDSSSHS